MERIIIAIFSAIMFYGCSVLPSGTAFKKTIIYKLTPQIDSVIDRYIAFHKKDVHQIYGVLSKSLNNSEYYLTISIDGYKSYKIDSTGNINNHETYLRMNSCRVLRTPNNDVPLIIEEYDYEFAYLDEKHNFSSPMRVEILRDDFTITFTRDSIIRIWGVRKN